MGGIPHRSTADIPDDWRIEQLGTQAGMPCIWWRTPNGIVLKVGTISGYPKQWRELLLREGKTEEQADNIINGPVRDKS